LRGGGGGGQKAQEGKTEKRAAHGLIFSSNAKNPGVDLPQSKREKEGSKVKGGEGGRTWSLLLLLAN